LQRRAADWNLNQAEFELQSAVDADTKSSSIGAARKRRQECKYEQTETCILSLALDASEQIKQN
jgi:hypothetical protein